MELVRRSRRTGAFKACLLALVFTLLIGGVLVFLVERAENQNLVVQTRFAMESFEDQVHYRLEGAEAQDDLADVLSEPLLALETNGYWYELLQIFDTGEQNMLAQSGILPQHEVQQLEIEVQDVRLLLRASSKSAGSIGWTTMISLLILVALSLLVAAFTYLIAQRRDGPPKPDELDVQTGLYTRAAGEKRIRRAISDERGAPLALVLLDVDNYTEINEQLGRQEGDRLLLRACARLRENAHSQDIIFHVMGDMMMVYLRGVGDDEALMARTEVLRHSFAQQLQTPDGAPLMMHASAGIARSPQQGTTYRELFEKADMALYWSKRDGGDRSSYYMESERSAAFYDDDEDWLV
ncbi:GGDEF domain-containing protein [Eubacteriales bacterium OttesenSCG-928-N13]|nr:GGDEF domain-containing protein [Eubacteriales bacterium OttesenSCG-928-N13]